MANKSRDVAERLARIVDGLGDYLSSGPDDELLEAAREDKRDLGKTNLRVKGILRNAFKLHQQAQLAEARAGYRRETEAMTAKSFQLPKTTEGRRELFMAAIARLPQYQPAFTWQNRELKDLSDDDIEVQLKKMALLDLLSKIKLGEDND
jgi:hypothetical protein